MNDELIKKTFLKMKERLPKAGTCPDEDDIARFVEGLMEEKEAEKIKEHLVLCPRCCDDYVSLCVTLDEITDLLEAKTLPEAPVEQINQVRAMVQAGKKPTHEKKNSESVSNRITQSLKNFFTFEWLAQPIPIAVKSSVVTILVVLIVYTTYFYSSQQSKRIGVPSPSIGPAEQYEDSSQKIPEADVTLLSDDDLGAPSRSLEDLFQGPQRRYRERSAQDLQRDDIEREGKALMDPSSQANFKAPQKRFESKAKPKMGRMIQGARAMPEIEAAQETVAIHYEEGFQHFHNGNYTKAEAEWKQGLKIDPSHEPSKKGLSYIRTKIEEHYQKGLEYFQDQNPSLAIQEWEKVVRYNPNYRNTAQYLENARKMQERLEQTEESNP